MRILPVVIAAALVTCSRAYTRTSELVQPDSRVGLVRAAQEEMERLGYELQAAPPKEVNQPRGSMIFGERRWVPGDSAASPVTALLDDWLFIEVVPKSYSSTPTQLESGVLRQVTGGYYALITAATWEWRVPGERRQVRASGAVRAHADSVAARLGALREGPAR